jgi:beta-phosphoglucomutase-like phosphatase (HAD superfamily)
VENAPLGIRAARAAGCAVVAICTTLTEIDLHQANWIVGNHEELQVLLLGDGPQNTDKRMSRISGEAR